MTIWNIQKAIYGVLSNDVALEGLVTGVFDFVPDNTVFPYVTVQLENVEEWSAHEQNGFEVNFAVVVFSKQAGSQKCWQIFDVLYGLLHDADWTVEGGYEVHNTRFEQAVLRKKESSELYELTADFVIQVTKIA